MSEFLKQFLEYSPDYCPVFLVYIFSLYLDNKTKRKHNFAQMGVGYVWKIAKLLQKKVLFENYRKIEMFLRILFLKNK